MSSKGHPENLTIFALQHFLNLYSLPWLFGEKKALLRNPYLLSVLLDLFHNFHSKSIEKWYRLYCDRQTLKDIPLSLSRLDFFVNTVPTCPPPPQPVNAVLFHASMPEEKRVKGSIVLYKCKQGYHYRGVMFVYCQGQKWTHVNFFCVRKYSYSKVKIKERYKIKTIKKQNTAFFKQLLSVVLSLVVACPQA